MKAPILTVPRLSASPFFSWLLGILVAICGVNTARGQGEVKLLFHFGSEKKEWLKEVTDTFNAAKHKDPAGRVIHVTLVPMGSKVCVEPLLDPARTSGPDLVSPASSVYVEWANGKAIGGPVIDPKSVKVLVRSPVVVAMWRERATKLGWPDKAIGWDELCKLARKGWDGGEKLKFAHTHPELSNSGLLALIAIAQARTANFDRPLREKDLEVDEVKDFVEAMEKSVVYYGESTGFLKDKMIERGPSAFHAVVLYENLVIAANQAFEKEAKKSGQQIELPKIVAIYPKEGTFLSDHPVGIVKRPWVVGKEAAAQTYIDYLLAKEQQDLAVKSGFRPADPKKDEKLDAPFNRHYGADVTQPSRILQAPSAAVVDNALALWREKKKRADVVLLIDISGSMETIDDPNGTANDTRLARAKRAALKLVDALSPQDTISVGTFHGRFKWVQQGVHPDNAATKKDLGDKINVIEAYGPTALYLASREGYRYLKEQASLNPDTISMLIILSDGEDTRDAKLPPKDQDLPKMEKELRAKDGVMVITLAYGKEASGDESKNLRAVLKKMAIQTEGHYYENVQAKDLDKFIQQIYELLGGRGSLAEK